MQCFIRQALEASRFVSDEPAFHDQIVRNILHYAAKMDLNITPPEAGQQLHRCVRKASGNADPYYELKRSYNRLALTFLPEIRKQIDASADPFITALRYVIAGNVIDLGANGNMSEQDAQVSIGQTLSDPFFGDVKAFQKAISEAKSILYLADNAGEIIFDRLLVEQLPMERVTLAVRGGPILNDALMEDAREAGLTELVTVIDNGSDAPGTILADCNEDFREKFHTADVIIAKGQGNFETLNDIERDVFFLFKVKCHVIADHCGQPLGTQALLQRKAL
jgi:hypothetical protein